jgi:hypothetical protein
VSKVKPSTSKKLPKQGGMGFVEVLVASAILGLTVAGSVTLLGGWTQTLSETRNRTDALVRLVSVMDLGKHEISLVDPDDPDYDAVRINGVVSPTQRISGFTLGDITTTAGVNRTKFEASIAWLNPYESGEGANSKFQLHSYHPERKGFVSVSSLTEPVCVGASCANVDDDCIVSDGSEKGKAKSDKSDGSGNTTICNPVSKSKSSKSVTYKNDKSCYGSGSNACEPTCGNNIQDLDITYPSPRTPGAVGAIDVNIIAGPQGNNPSVTFSASGNCTTSGYSVTYQSEGDCSIVATRNPNGCGWANWSETTSLPISCAGADALQIDNSGTFAALNPFDDESFSLSTSGGISGVDRILSSDTLGICSVNGTTVNFNAAGSCTIRLSQAGSCAPNPVTATTTVVARPGPGQCTAQQTSKSWVLDDVPACNCKQVDKSGVITDKSSKSGSSC